MVQPGVDAALSLPRSWVQIPLSVQIKNKNKKYENFKNL